MITPGALYSLAVALFCGLPIATFLWVIFMLSRAPEGDEIPHVGFVRTK